MKRENRITDGGRNSLPPLYPNARLFNAATERMAGIQSPSVMKPAYLGRDESELDEIYTQKGIRFSETGKLPSERLIEFYSKRHK